MKLTAAFLGLVGLTSTAAATSSSSSQPLRSLHHDLDANDYYVLHLDANTAPDQVAFQLGLVHKGQLGELNDHHVFSSEKTQHDVVKRELAERRRRKRELGSSPLDGVLFSQKQVLRKPWEKRVVPPSQPADLHGRNGRDTPAWSGSAAARARRDADPAATLKQNAIMQELDIHDPIFGDQWHLFNAVQVGHDVNVTGLWLEGITGHNTTVAIIDDGLDMYSDDLKDNYYAAGSYDFNDPGPEPRPRLSDDKHGTRCAGEISAVRNKVCGIGVAYDAKVAGLRILSKAISDADEALAMTYDFHNNLIYSCSWGPPDDGRSMDAPGILIRRAMLKAVQEGRHGLGSIYVFASGNGAGSEDNCNFDGYTNSIYSITVGAIDRKGEHPYYSEKCSASLVVTYSSGGGDAIHTTDVGTNACYSEHGGTSAAAPLAAGIFALALQVRPDLTWRDMQYLVLLTAVPVNVDSGDWQDTYIGKKYSHTFAYGKVDSYGLVEAAKTWEKVKPQAWYYTPWVHVRQPIPEGDTGLAVAVDITEDMLKAANLARVEHVTLTMNIEHTRRGDLSVDLISPEKVVSHMSATRKYDNLAAGYVDWTFMSVVHWGEPGVGKWTVVVKDTVANGHTGNFTDFHLKLWGESIDASKATVLPMPSETDDDDHDITSTTTLMASTTTLPPGGPATKPTDSSPAKPSNHPDRPVKPKPTTPSSTTATQSTSVTQSTTAAQPTETDGSSTEHDTETSPSPTSSSVSWLPAILQNMSTKTQIWIYGALGLIGAFCIGLCVYLYLARRRRLRNDPRDNYEFELLDEEEGEALNGDDDGDIHNDHGHDGAGLGTPHNEKGFSGGGKLGGGGGLGGGAGGGRRKGRATRGRELYDAFADGSDDEDEDEDEGESAENVRRRGDVDSGVDDSEDDEDTRRSHLYQQKQGIHGIGSSVRDDETMPHHVVGEDSDDDDDDNDDDTSENEKDSRRSGGRDDQARLL